MRVEKKGKMRKKKRRRDSLDPGGSGLSHFKGYFLKFWGSGFLVLEVQKKEEKGGVAVNPIGMNVVCLSHFFCVCLCL